MFASLTGVRGFCDDQIPRNSPRSHFLCGDTWRVALYPPHRVDPLPNLRFNHILAGIVEDEQVYPTAPGLDFKIHVTANEVHKLVKIVKFGIFSSAVRLWAKQLMR